MSELWHAFRHRPQTLDLQPRVRPRAVIRCLSDRTVWWRSLLFITLLYRLFIIQSLCFVAKRFASVGKTDWIHSPSDWRKLVQVRRVLNSRLRMVTRSWRHSSWTWAHVGLCVCVRCACTCTWWTRAEATATAVRIFSTRFAFIVRLPVYASCQRCTMARRNTTCMSYMNFIKLFTLKYLQHTAPTSIVMIKMYISNSWLSVGCIPQKPFSLQPRSMHYRVIQTFLRYDNSETHRGHDPPLNSFGKSQSFELSTVK